MSVINKMLNDLDENKPDTELKQEVAFLQPKQERNKLSTKTRLRLASGVLTIIVALIVAYLYYPNLMETSRTLDLLEPQASSQPAQQAPANEDNKPQQTNSPATPATTDTQELQTVNTEQVVAQPKLVVLSQVDENGKPIERQSTLSVQTAPVQSQNPPSVQRVVDEGANANVNASTNASQSKNQNVDVEEKTEQQITTKSSEQANEPVTYEANQESNQETNQKTNQKTKQETVATNPTKTSKDGDGQMSISHVNLSNEERAQKHAIQAQKLAQQGLIQPAIEKYQQAIEVYPMHQQARIAIAGLYYGRNMVAEALEVLSQGLNIEPGNRAWSLLAAKIHFRRDNFAAAMAYLQLPVHPAEDVEYVVLKATTLQKLKDYEAAASVFSQLTMAFPESARWWLGLATSLEGQQKTTEAIEAYRQTLRLGSISQSSRRFVLKRLAQLER